jgi:hypothetical protein
MVVPWRRRATTSPAQGTSEGRVSEDMAADTVSAPRGQGFPHHDKEIEPCPGDLVKHPG